MIHNECVSPTEYLYKFFNAQTLCPKSQYKQHLLYAMLQNLGVWVLVWLLFWFDLVFFSLD